MMDKFHSQGSLAQGSYHPCQTLIATQGDRCQGLKQRWEEARGGTRAITVSSSRPSAPWLVTARTPPVQDEGVICYTPFRVRCN